MLVLGVSVSCYLALWPHLCKVWCIYISYTMSVVTVVVFFLELLFQNQISGVASAFFSDFALALKYRGYAHISRRESGGRKAAFFRVGLVVLQARALKHAVATGEGPEVSNSNRPSVPRRVAGGAGAAGGVPD